MTTIRCLLLSLLATLFGVLLAGFVMLTHPQTAAALDTPTHLKALEESISKAGISVVVNDKERCKLPVLGSYYPGRDLIVICQQGAQPGDSENKWSPSDFTVLMHESTHLLQDCRSGSIRDMQLVRITSSEEELAEYIDILPEEYIQWIFKAYTEGGADDLTLQLELEAFSTQLGADPDVLAAAITNTCPIR